MELTQAQRDAIEAAARAAAAQNVAPLTDAQRAAIEAVGAQLGGQNREWTGGANQVLPERTLLHRIGDNLIGYDDGVMSPGEKLGAGINMAAEGLSFGLVGDEANAYADSLIGRGEYDERRDFYRDQERQFRDENPVIAAGAEILPSLALPGLAIGRAAGLGMKSLVGAGTGALAGGTYGFMEGEGGLDNRMATAGAGAALGGLVGGVAPAAFAGARAVLGRPMEGLATLFRGVPSERRAAERIATTLERSGQSADDAIAAVRGAADDGQDVYTLADALGISGQRALAGVARQPGPARQFVADLLERRQLGQAGRLTGFVNDALGLSDDTAAQARVLAQQFRRDMATPNYAGAAAQARPVDTRAALAVIDDALATADLGPLRPTRVNSALQEYRDMLTVRPGNLQDGVEAMDLSDFRSVLAIKSQISDDITRLTRAGENNQARVLIPLRDALDAALEEASPGYRMANDTYRAQSQVIDAIDTGAQFARPARVEDALDAYRNLATTPARGTEISPQGPIMPANMPDRQAAFRIGYGDAMLLRPENVTPTTDATRLFRTPTDEALMREMATDPDLWSRRLARENTMFTTNNLVTRGSMTADNLADQADMAGDLNIFTNIVTGRFGTATGQVAQRLAALAGGENEQTRALIARVLTSNDPGPALRQLMDRAETVEARREIASILLRQAVITQSIQ